MNTHQDADKNAQSEPGLDRRLATRMAWNPAESFYRYACRVAELNGTTLRKMLGRDYLASAWRTGDPQLLADLAAVTGVDLTDLTAWSPRRFNLHRQPAQVLGYLTSDARDSTTLLTVLPDDDPRTSLIRDPRTWGVSRAIELDAVAEYVVPRLTLTWPPVAPGDEWERARRAVVLHDPTRNTGPHAWSVPVRIYAALTLWPIVVDPDAFGDYQAARRWARVAEQLRTDWPAVSQALTTMSAQWPVPNRHDRPLPTVRDLRVPLAATGPFRVTDLSVRWSPAARHTIHAATVGLEALRQRTVGLDPDSWISAVLPKVAAGLMPPVPDAAHSTADVALLAADAWRIVTWPGGAALLSAVADRAGKDPAPFTPTELAPWWNYLTDKFAPANHRWLPRAGRFGVAEMLCTIWTDLTGHAPVIDARLGHPHLEDAAAATDAEAMLRIRDYVTRELHLADNLGNTSSHHISTSRPHTGAEL